MNEEHKIRSGILILLASAMILATGCKEKDPACIPEPETSAITAITENGAVGGGTVISDGDADITSCGICWATGRIPTVNDSKTVDQPSSGSYTSTLTGLVKNTSYSVRAYATNSAGTGYGEVVTFSTLQGSGTVADADGNRYDTVKIGTQVWLVQNLKTTHYRNGDPIDNLTDNTQWCNSTTGAWCDFENDIDNTPVYGRIYNWFAVSDPRKIAPEGYHVATDADWATLISFLGGEEVAGGKLKEAGTAHWLTPNTDATNESGFTAVPGGTRYGQYGMPGYGTFTNLGRTAEWWTADEQFTRGAGYNTGQASHDTNSRQSDGFNVRCVKD